jgi:hypothetical protein
MFKKEYFIIIDTYVIIYQCDLEYFSSLHLN